ncbi:MAG: prepilin-type N-terminal cleavage/methylation domain-containing protein [Burkholderiales bacterium]
MVKQQKGFTIIELVVVIVILGILAAVAFPKFQDLSGDARQAVVNGTAAAVRSAAVLLYAKNQGSKNSAANIILATDYDSAVSVTNPSGCNILVQYGTTTASTTVTISSDYCI